jgi:DNA-binding SARP family transcriptional activator/ABC-type glycerol-3-phosphate transport system substrate-binding protein/tRNA A-37 threonylcarbamoyl transferase component Bud32
MAGGDLQFRILGSLQFERDGNSVDLGSYKQRSLLALMLLNPNQIVSTDRILDELWGETAGAGKQNALWVHVSNLRSALELERPARSEGTILLTRSPGYLLRVEAAQLDSTRFELLVSEGHGLLSSDPPAAALVFAEALALWRGRALEEFTYESFAQAEINRLESLRLDAVEGRIEADLARGLRHQLIGELQGLVREHPLRERFTALLMMALYRSQRQAEALRVFSQLRARLGSELGIEPSEPLRDLEEQIVMGDPRLEPIATVWVPGGPEPGLAVRGYELRSNLGKTRFGMVYRGYQPAIGREVAIKVIRPELANDPAFIRRFEAEANLIAGLESANVVPLYDFWREPDAAFLVEKLVTGGDLGALVAVGPVPSDRVMSIVEQIARPLRLAHDLGVIHGGLRLENVLLDEAGNAHVTDFGIASETDASVGADIESLASVAAQLLAGGHGAVRELVTRIDPLVAGVVSAAVDRHRFSSVDAFVDALRAAIGTKADVPEVPTMAANPYKGLEPFDETDTGQFFGRERLIERMLARLGGVEAVRRFLAVVGPSGSGKSSVVSAGLIPALRAGGVAGSDKWFIVTMTPGVHPFEGLERAVAKVAVNTPPMLLDQMLAEPSGLRRSIDAILPDQVSPLVLVVDQFEELYTIAAEDERQAFAAALVEAVTHPRSRLRVVITLRADFYDHPLATPGLGELLRDHTELVTPMTPSELESAISRPAETVGVVVQPALLAALTADAVSDSAVLPMLQYSLTELFERRHGHTMTAAAYEAMGGLTGAVVQRAESLFSALTPEARSVARHVFLRLVSVNDAGESTRRRALLSELQTLEGRDGYLDDMLRAFARHRLLSFDRDPASRGPTVEIAHEALIGAWARLSGWIDDTRDDLRAQRRLAAAAVEWVDQEKNADFLLTGASLSRYADWQSDPPVRLTSSEQAFLHMALERQKEHEQAERDRLLHESQLRRRTRALVGVGAMALLVVFLAALAFAQGQSARNLAGELAASERARKLVTESGLVIRDDPDLAILLAIEAIRATESTGSALPEAMDALHWALQAAATQFPSMGTALPVAVRPNPSGPRGVFALSPTELVGIGRDVVKRGLSPAECDRYFPQDECPDMSVPIRPDLGIAGGIDGYSSLVDSGTALTGTRVVVTGQFTQEAKDALLTEFGAAVGSLGIDVVYRSNSFIQDVAEVAMGDDPGDIVLLSAPGEMADVAAVRPIVDIGGYLGEQYLQDSYGHYLTSLGRMDDGHIYGLFIKVDAKSSVWYNAEAFADAGYAEPATWDQLITLSNQIVLDDRTPWCLSAFQDAVTGWPITDWLETIVLRSESPEFYDSWASHEIPFDSPELVAALSQVGLLAHSPDYVFPDPAIIGVRTILESLLLASFDDPLLTSQDDPQCWMVPGPTWVRGVFQDAPMVAMPFPTINPLYPSAMGGSGDIAIVMSDRPEVRAVVRAMASPAWGETWAQSDDTFFAPHKAFDLEIYADPVSRSIAGAIRDSIDAESYRFDASDQMPGPVTEVLHSALVQYVTHANASAEEALASVEAAWIEYEAGLDG